MGTLTSQSWTPFLELAVAIKLGSTGLKTAAWKADSCRAMHIDDPKKHVTLAFGDNFRHNIVLENIKRHILRHNFSPSSKNKHSKGTNSTPASMYHALNTKMFFLLGVIII